MQKLKNNEAQQKFTGSSKKKGVHKLNVHFVVLILHIAICTV